MAEYDLTSKIGSYMDRHLIFPLLEFLSERKIYDEADMLKARIELLSKTNMVDYALDVFKTLYPDGEDPPDLVAHRSEVVDKLHEYEVTIQPIIQLFEHPDVAKTIESGKEDQSLFDYLVENHEFEPQMVDLVYNCAKFKYECGNYSEASEYLYFYRVVAPPDHKNVMSAMWGKLSCSVLMQDWDMALEDLNKLRKDIDETLNAPPLEKLQQRAWLIHWSLFVYFNHPKGQDEIIAAFLYQPDYLNAIHTSCPHILRYLTAAVITNKRRPSLLKDLVRVIRQASSSYRDPVTEFVECLYINFDFDSAQTKLVECEKVLDHDFFLVACRAEFIENARLSIFETFCRIHNCISISMLATKLNMSTDDAERWIVNLIRNAKLDAKIDAKEFYGHCSSCIYQLSLIEDNDQHYPAALDARAKALNVDDDFECTSINISKGHVIMNTQAPSIYQRVIDKTKALAFQSQFLAQSIEKKLAPQAAPAYPGMVGPQRWIQGPGEI